MLWQVCTLGSWRTLLIDHSVTTTVLFPLQCANCCLFVVMCAHTEPPRLLSTQMKSNEEQAADPCRRAVENVNLDDSTSREKRHVQHRGKHSLQLPQYRERHCTPNLTCLHGDTRCSFTCRHGKGRTKHQCIAVRDRAASNQCATSGSTSMLPRDNGQKHVYLDRTACP